MPLNFDEAMVNQLQREFSQLTGERQARIDALAAMVFVNLHLVGLVSSDLPQTVPQLKSREVAKLRMLAMQLEAVYAMTTAYGGG